MITEELTDRDILELMGVNRLSVRYFFQFRFTIVQANCSNCGNVTDWDFGLSEKPLCRECWDNSNVIEGHNEIYKKILTDDALFKKSQSMIDVWKNHPEKFKERSVARNKKIKELCRRGILSIRNGRYIRLDR